MPSSLWLGRVSVNFTGSPNLLIPQTITIVFTYLSKLGFLDLGYTEHPSFPRVDVLELLGDLIPFIVSSLKSALSFKRNMNGNCIDLLVALAIAISFAPADILKHYRNVTKRPGSMTEDPC
jgi:hypothetical protein